MIRPLGAAATIVDIETTVIGKISVDTTEVVERVIRGAGAVINLVARIVSTSVTVMALLSSPMLLFAGFNDR